jgi:hypothetical protein
MARETLAIRCSGQRKSKNTRSRTSSVLFTVDHPGADGIDDPLVVARVIADDLQRASAATFAGERRNSLWVADLTYAQGCSAVYRQ